MNPKTQPDIRHSILKMETHQGSSLRDTQVEGTF